MLEQYRKGSGWIRWYDGLPNLKYILTEVENKPDNIKVQVGEEFSTIVEAYKRKYKVTISPCMVSAETMNSLRKTTNRNRWYDEVPTFATALKVVLMLDPQQRSALDEYFKPLATSIMLGRGKKRLPSFR